jgi:tRNA pseudouridine(55) synthase
MTDIQNQIHKFYKKMGETPRECIYRYKKDNPELLSLSMTYAGRLDPMAEGLLLVLSGDAIFEKDKYLGLTKVYEFEILWEFETDTLDILGVVKHDDISIFPTEADVQKKVKETVGKFEQSYPAYSSQPAEGVDVDGKIVSKPLVEWSRLGKINEIKIPSHEVEIFEAEYEGRRFESGADLLQKISSRINLVTGDFRQGKISGEWKKILESHAENQYAIDKIKIKVSGGFYVRQFVADLAKSLNVKALTYHILRTEVGEYRIVESEK